MAGCARRLGGLEASKNWKGSWKNKKGKRKNKWKEGRERCKQGAKAWMNQRDCESWNTGRKVGKEERGTEGKRKSRGGDGGQGRKKERERWKGGKKERGSEGKMERGKEGTRERGKAERKALPLPAGVHQPCRASEEAILYAARRFMYLFLIF